MFRASVLMSSLKETCIYKNVTKVVWSLRTGCPASFNVDNVYERQRALKPGHFTVSADSSATPVHPAVLFCPNFQPAQHLSVSPPVSVNRRHSLSPLVSTILVKMKAAQGHDSQAQLQKAPSQAPKGSRMFPLGRKASL